MALDPMQQGAAMATQPTEAPENEANEPKGTEVCLTVGQDGSLSIRVEDDTQDGGNEEMPVADINEALKSIKAIVENILSSKNPDAQAEQSAFEGEMKQGL